MPFEINIGDYFLKTDDIKRLIDVEYKNSADKEFVSYFLKKYQKLPNTQEMKNV